MKRRLGSGRILPPAGFEPVIRSRERLPLSQAGASVDRMIKYSSLFVTVLQFYRALHVYYTKLDKK